MATGTGVSDLPTTCLSVTGEVLMSLKNCVATAYLPYLYECDFTSVQLLVARSSAVYKLSEMS